jgi:ribosomal-protein-alanine N-acetyltransferase
VALRERRESDVATVQEASRDPQIPLITAVASTDDEAEALASIARQHDRLRTRTGYVFAIADNTDRAIGHIGMSSVPRAGARSSIGYWILPSQRRRGYAAEALRTLTKWAMTHSPLDRVELYVEPGNEGSWRAAESAGFEREGLLQAWERIDGTPRDMFMYAQLIMRT